MNKTNETMFDQYCGKWAWMCKKFAQNIVDISEEGNMNISEAHSVYNRFGKLLDLIEYVIRFNEIW